MKINIIDSNAVRRTVTPGVKTKALYCWVVFVKEGTANPIPLPEFRFLLPED